MTEQFQNPAEVKVEEDGITDNTAQRKIERVADKAAAKSTKTEQKFDKENSPLFNK
jgi:hypothetical protein